MKPEEQKSNEMNARLKAAVNSVEVPPFLDAKIRRRIQEHEEKPSRRRWSALATAGATAALLAAIGLTYQLGHLRQTAGDQESFIVSVSTKVATLMRVGLGDHIHCAFFRKFPQEAPAVEEMESKLGPEYKDLLPAVRQYVPEEYKLVLGHQCRYNGRQFIHLSLKSDSKLMSLVITAKKVGESFNIEGMLPELVQSGIPVYGSATDRFQIAAMETSNHLIYFISDLPRKQNTAILVAMAPSLKVILENLEG
jgi:hypothetical protein